MYFLYNGVPLPSLPEPGKDYDGEKYPYVFITCQQTESSKYGLRLLAYVCVCEKPATKISTGVAMPKNAKYRSFRCANEAENNYRAANGEELMPPMSEGFVPYLDERTASGNKMSYPCIWSDHDILDSSGAVYMAASEPVPVNEKTGSISFIQFLVNPKYRHITPFRGIAGWKTAQIILGDTGNTVTNSLVSADGHILTDKNGVYLIHEEAE